MWYRRGPGEVFNRTAVLGPLTPLGLWDMYSTAVGFLPGGGPLTFQDICAPAGSPYPMGYVMEPGLRLPADLLPRL
jgi:hypothetical protein